MKIRTRFAPSPTGYLHIGGARTALFNYLFARHNGGRFILRIEDTDRERSKEEYTEAILEDMRWLGLEWDEGPFYQSHRFALYREHAERLLNEGHAYRCYCTPEELEERREEALKRGRPPKYDGRCRELETPPEGRKYALRFRVPEGRTILNDIVRGTIAFEHQEIEDFVVLRSDRTPTYNLCVVVDDALMEITHIIRGDDHINNTPKQMLLYRALDYPTPEFAHLPMLLGPDRTRLSKRHGATAVGAYMEMGYLPHALVNYLARLGWSHGDQEIFSREELIEKFTLEGVGRSPGVFNPEKLLWLNHHYIKSSSPEELMEPFLRQLDTLGVDATGDERLPLIMRTLQERAKTLKEMAESSLFYFTEKVEFDEKAEKKFLTHEKAALLEMIRDGLKGLEPFTAEDVRALFEQITEEQNIRLKDIAQPVRVALTGRTVSPGIFDTIEAMGRELAIKRLEDAIRRIKDRAREGITA